LTLKVLRQANDFFASSEWHAGRLMLQNRLREKKRLIFPRGFGTSMSSRHSWFNRFAKWAARATGHPLAFLLAVCVIVIWALTGPIFGFDDTWQLVINTGTTIVTFLMVFLIQNSQNRDGAALQIKLDELIRALEGAQNALLDLEELEDKDLEIMRQRYEKLASEAREGLKADTTEAGSPAV
jgi:low affinity Fe/Cu permease